MEEIKNQFSVGKSYAIEEEPGSPSLTPFSQSWKKAEVLFAANYEVERKDGSATRVVIVDTKIKLSYEDLFEGVFTCVDMFPRDNVRIWVNRSEAVSVAIGYTAFPNLFLPLFLFKERLWSMDPVVSSKFQAKNPWFRFVEVA